MTATTRLLLVCLAATFAITNAFVNNTKLELKTRQSQNGTSSGGADLSSHSKTHGAAKQTTKVDDILRRDALTKSKAVQKSEAIGKGAFTQVTETKADVTDNGSRRGAQSTAQTAGVGNTTGSALTVGDSSTKALLSDRLKGSLDFPFLKVNATRQQDQKASVNQHGGSIGHGKFRFNNTAVTDVKRTDEYFSPRLPLPVSQTTTAQVAQEGGTGGGGVLSGNGTANSAAKAGVRLVLGNDLRVNFAGRSGASAGSLAARGGQYNQTAGSRSDVRLNGGSDSGSRARVDTEGAGSSRGDAHIQQDAAAKGVGRTALDFVVGGVNNSFAGKAKAAEQHGATSNYNGQFKLNTTAETAFRRDRLG